MFNLLLDERLVQVVWWWCHILLLQLIWIEIICTCTSIVRWWSYRVCRSRFRWLEPFHWMVQPINNKWIAVIHYRMVPHICYCNMTCNTSATKIRAVPNIPSGYYQGLICKKMSQLFSISNYYYNRHHMSCIGLQIPVVISKLNIIYLVTVTSTVLFHPALTGSPSLITTCMFLMVASNFQNSYHINIARKRWQLLVLYNNCSVKPRWLLTKWISLSHWGEAALYPSIMQWSIQEKWM